MTVKSRLSWDFVKGNLHARVLLGSLRITPGGEGKKQNWVERKLDCCVVVTETSADLAGALELG